MGSCGQCRYYKDRKLEKALHSYTLAIGYCPYKCPNPLPRPKPPQDQNVDAEVKDEQRDGREEQDQQQPVQVEELQPEPNEEYKEDLVSEKGS